MASGISNFLSKFFGGFGSRGREGAGDTAATSVVEDYNGYSIRPAPFQDRDQWITSGVIEKQFGDEVKMHRFIRADMYPSEEAATDASVFKAKQLIDIMGDNVFALETG